MVHPAQPLPPPQPRPEWTFVSEVERLAEAVAQIAIRILFVAAQILMAGALLPISLQGIGLPIVALGSTLLAGFFFLPPDRMQIPDFDEMPPLIRPAVGRLIPVEMPRGIPNRGNNCALNALIHFLESDPYVADWLRGKGDFEDFLRSYRISDPEIEAFRAFREQSPKPEPCERDLFSQFLAENGSPFEETYRDIRRLQKAFSSFFAAYDQAVEEGREAVAMTAKGIRTALGEGGNREELDAHEALQHVLNLLPPAQQMQIEVIRRFVSPEAHEPYMSADAAPEVCLTLEIGEADLNPRLQEMFDHYRDYEQSGLNFRHNGITYPSARLQRAFLEAPSALRFQIKRFIYQNPPDNRWTHFKRRLGINVEGRTIKRDMPVEVPAQITVLDRPYYLRSFLTHRGDRSHTGHYIAGRAINGNYYLMDGPKVTTDRADWEAEVRQAYLLCYLPAPAQPN